MVHSFWRVLMFLDDNIYVIANISKREAVSGQNVFEVFWVDCYRQGDEQILKMLDFLSFWCRAAWIEKKKTKKIVPTNLRKTPLPWKSSAKISYHTVILWSQSEGINLLQISALADGDVRELITWLQGCGLLQNATRVKMFYFQVWIARW